MNSGSRLKRSQLQMTPAPFPRFAAVEQSSGIEQINVAVTQMDEMTQQNAALVEEAAAAAESLNEQANSMSAAVSVFRLDHHSGPSARAKAKPMASSASSASSTHAAALPAPKAKAKAVASKAGRSAAAEDEWQEF